MALKHSDPHLHNFLKGLPYEMKKRSVIAFDGYGNNIGKKAIIIDSRSGALSNVLVAVEDRGLNYGNIEINDIATVHERRDIRSTLNKASVFYLNEKSTERLNSLGLQLPSDSVINANFNISNNSTNSSDGIQYSIGGNSGYVGYSMSVRARKEGMRMQDHTEEMKMQ